MTTAKHVLVPHDFGELADRALDYAIDLAEKLGAAVTVVHAYDIPVYTFPDGPALTPAVARQVEEAARAALEGIVTRSRRPSVVLGALLRRGPPWSEINAAAVEAGADLIVIGTHARRGVARALLGSTAEKVVRTAPCPVLTVHAHDFAGR